MRVPDENYIWLDCTCDEQILTRNDFVAIVKGQVVKIKVTFETSFEWDERTVVARFQMGDKKCDITVDDDNILTIPHEITDVFWIFPDGSSL